MTNLDIEILSAVNDNLKKGLERKFLEFGWLYNAAPVKLDDGYGINVILENPCNYDFPEFLKQQVEKILRDSYVHEGKEIPFNVLYKGPPQNYEYCCNG